VEFRLFGQRESDPPSLISFARMPDLWAVLLGRLYYRRELLAYLGSPSSEDANPSATTNDAALALAAYSRWGTEGIARLEGDYALVLWDTREGRLLGARDPLGSYSLFWTQSGRTVGLSTHLRELLDLLPRRSLNLDYLAEFLVLPCIAAQEPTGELCVFEGVHRVPAGNLVLAKLPHGSVQVHPYWHWDQHVVEPGTDRLQSLAERYGELLRQAVRERVRGRTACHLSGGMDSTAVALIARDWLARIGGPPLHAFSLVYERLSGLARERHYLESVLEEHPDIVAHRVYGDNLLDYDSLADPPPHEEPWPWLPRIAAEVTFTELMAQAGIATVLTGIGSDEFLDVPPFHIADLLRRGRLIKAWKEAARWAEGYSCSLRTVLCEFGIAPTVPAGLYNGLGFWLRRGFATWKKQNNHSIPPWIRPDFARQHGLWERLRANIRRTYSACRPVAVSVAINALFNRYGDLSRRYLAADRGIHVAHPFFDPRVASFALGSLTRYYGEPGARKPILAEAMRGVLPEPIRTRRRKGHFGECTYLGLSRNLPGLETLVRKAPVEDLGMFDKEILLQCLQQSALGIPTDFGVLALGRLNLTLALLTWLSRYDEWLRVSDAPTETILGRCSEPASHDSALVSLVHSAPA
jgi:asparagine synthase (glutamine-hydrolysing)